MICNHHVLTTWQMEFSKYKGKLLFRGPNSPSPLCRHHIVSHRSCVIGCVELDLVKDAPPGQGEHPVKEVKDSAFCIKLLYISPFSGG